VYGPARTALTVDTVLRARELALNLIELGVGLLQFGGPASEHIQAIVVADRHFVGEPTEIPGQLRHALSQLVAAAVQVG
jgi:hypothetical protein